MYNILIVNKEQYGYHIDTYKYCSYLSEEFNVTYLCWDDGKRRIISSGVNCIYLERKGNILNRFLILVRSVNKEIKTNKYDLIFIIYFFGCSILKLLNFNSVFNLDVRTIAVTKKKILNFFLDKILNLESHFFENITVISKETGKQIKISNFTVVPLGGECLVKSKIPSNDLNLIYVGTLSNRNIMDLVKGFLAYTVKYSVKRKTTLTLIGDGYNNELEMLNQFIKSHNLENLVFTTGYIQNNNLGHYFEKASCGVSFVPITPYYQNQPPTKTYEYLLSGLPVLATNTNANAKIIDVSNGILIQDDVDSVADGIFSLSEKLDSYNSEKIRKDMEPSLWKNIVNNILHPYLIDIILKSKLKE
jgi:glycosyltransferase involved in cell wall biosynthesis